LGLLIYYRIQLWKRLMEKMKMHEAMYGGMLTFLALSRYITLPASWGKGRLMNPSL
jgi:hypothetical protein